MELVKMRAVTSMLRRADLQQLDLRHDRRADEPHHAHRRQVHDERVRQRGGRLRPLRAGPCRGGDVGRPRGTAWAYRQLVDVIAGGIAHKGSAAVEAMTACPASY